MFAEQKFSLANKTKCFFVLKIDTEVKKETISCSENEETYFHIDISMFLLVNFIAKVFVVYCV